MKFIVTKENLLMAISKASRAVSNRPALPILSNIMLSAEGDKLIVTATDREITIVTWIPALVEEEGATTLPAKKFQQIVSALPSSDVTMESDDENISSVKCKSSFYKIPGLSASDFPKMEEVQYDWSLKMKIRDLIRGLTKVVYARSQDDNRKQLNGVVFSIRGGMLTFAATDGRRLALMENTLDEDGAKDGDYILPSRASIELAGCLDGNDDVLINLSKSGISFQTTNSTIVTKLVDGTYPNFRQVIPENCGNKVTLQRVAFTDALKRVSLIVIDKGGSVKLTFSENSLTVSASHPEAGESSETMEIDYQGEEVVVSFNPVFFTDPLKIMEADNICIEFGKQYTPIKLTGDDGFLYMLMPMRG